MIRSLMALLAVLLMAGCHRTHIAATTQPAIEQPGLATLSPNTDVEAIVSPPAGWTADPLKKTARHRHQVWVSPSGDTAYGVIHAELILPVGPDLVLAGFITEMRKKEGEGRILETRDDSAIDGVRFVAEGGRYKLRANLMVRDWSTWVIYAGTLRARPENPEELKLAEQAREATIIGLPQK